MHGSVVPYALHAYCTIRGLTRKQALAELDRLVDVLGPGRPILVESDDLTPDGSPALFKRIA